jgi:hypothetical protein
MATHLSKLPYVVVLHGYANRQYRSFLHSPFWFCSAALEPVSQSMATASTALAGCLVSSLHKVKLQDNIGK